MRRYSLIALAAGAIGLVASVASAADLPRKAPAYQPPPPPPPFNWTGFYTGFFLGAGWARNEFDNNSVGVGDDFSFADGGGAIASNSGVGPLGGITVGYNWQTPGSMIVWGIEGDFAWTDIKGSNSFNRTGTDGFTFGCFTFFDCSHFSTANGSARTAFKVEDLATITGRFGLASGPGDRTLWYIKGGGAWERTKVNIAAQANAVECTNFILGSTCDSASVSGAASDSFNKWGWTVGTGLEFGLWDHWSGKVEYDFMQFGSRTFSFSTDAHNFFEEPLNVSTQLKEQIHVVKIGLNYRWGAWGGKAPY